MPHPTGVLREEIMRPLLSAAAVAAALACTTPASATELKMVSGFPVNFILTEEIAKPFIAAVAEATQGRVTIALSGPDAVPTFEQFEPVQAGVFDLLFTHPAYHSGTTGVGLTIDAVAADPTRRRTSGVFDYIAKHYEDLGLKLLAAPPTGSKGFRFYLRAPIDGHPGLEGRKIRGTVSYHPMIRALGGSPVNLPGGEIYTSLQKSVIDGAAWGLTGAADFKWYEVASHYAEPVFGQVGLMIFMNLDAWKALPQADRTAIEAAGRELELNSIARFNDLAVTELEALKGHGMQATTFAPEDAGRLETLWEEGVWEVAIGKSGADASALREIARKADLTN